VPLSSPAAEREPFHTRSIAFEAFRRPDGWFDLELHLIDVKPYDCPLESGVRPAGEPVHDMWLRLTVDTDYTVRDAELVMDAMPYTGYCNQVLPDYKKLIGLSLRSNFRLRAAELFRGTAGCAHLNEMLGLFPTAAVQSLYQNPVETADKPFQLDRCHALETTSEAVRRYYPRWYRGAAANTTK
jgi:hypothetical protein